MVIARHLPMIGTGRDEGCGRKSYWEREHGREWCGYIVSCDLDIDDSFELIQSVGPDSLVVAVPEGTEPNPHDESQAILEKYTMVQMSLAFAVAVKHYLRGEEGM